MIVEFDCIVCGTHVRRRRSPANGAARARYCSAQCFHASRRGQGEGIQPNVTYQCERCGVEVTTYRSPNAPAPRFCSLACLGAAQRGEGNPSYTGGRVVHVHGYVWRLAADHLAADCRGYVLEHRLVMEHHIGRLLTAEEVVHHRNCVPGDNRIDNLQLFANQGEHVREHARMRKNAA